MNIILNPEQQRFIEEKLSSGNYHSIDEIIVEALRRLEERDKHYERWVEETCNKVAIGIAQLNQKEGLDGESVVAQIQEKFRKAREGQG